MGSQDCTNFFIDFNFSDRDRTMGKTAKNKTGAERMKAWRERLQKNDPERFEAYKKATKEASKVSKTKLSEEKKARARELGRLRQQRLRDRKKAEKEQKPVKTRATQEQKRRK